MTLVTVPSPGLRYPTPAIAACGLSLAHPLSLRRADTVASDRCRPARAGRLGRRQQLDCRIAHGGLDQWRGRAFARDARSDGFEKGGSGGRDAAADDDARDAEGQDERSDRSGQVVGYSVGDLDRHLVAGRAGAEDICGSRMRSTGPCSDRQRSPRRPGERSRDRRRSSRGSRADRTRRGLRPHRRRRGPPRRQACCRRGAVPRREPRPPRCRSRSPGRRRSPAPQPTSRPPARSATAPPRGRRARRRSGRPAPSAASVPVADG